MEAAKAELVRSLALDPNLSEAHYTLGIIHWQSGEFEQAAKEMRFAIALSPDYSEAYFKLGTNFTNYKYPPGYVDWILILAL